jgi:hypothetical protein
MDLNRREFASLRNVEEAGVNETADVTPNVRRSKCIVFLTLKHKCIIIFTLLLITLSQIAYILSSTSDSAMGQLKNITARAVNKIDLNLLTSNNAT